MLVWQSVARLLTDIGYSHALEAGLPVATLLATLVMCWYSPLGTMPPQLDPARAVPMLIVCPTTLGVMIAFIQRGFRRYPLTCLYSNLRPSLLLVCVLNKGPS